MHWTRRGRSVYNSDVIGAAPVMRIVGRFNFMSTTTDFQEWLGNVELEDYEEVYSLYRAVKDATSFGIFDVELAKGGGERWIVTASSTDQSLLIASGDAKAAFLQHLTGEYYGDLDMEGWYSFKRAMSKDD
jgi:hypothetical protein